MDGNLIKDLKDIEGITTCSKIKSLSFLDNPINNSNEINLYDMISAKMHNVI